MSNTPQHERLKRHIARTIVWHKAQDYQKRDANLRADSIVDGLLAASANGKAVDRALRSLCEDTDA